MRTLGVATVMGWLFAGGAHAQAPRPQVSPPVFRADVTRVEVTVHVVDGKGVPVAGLLGVLTSRSLRMASHKPFVLSQQCHAPQSRWPVGAGAASELG